MAKNDKFTASYDVMKPGSHSVVARLSCYIDFSEIEDDMDEEDMLRTFQGILEDDLKSQFYPRFSTAQERNFLTWANNVLARREKEKSA